MWNYYFSVSPGMSNMFTGSCNEQLEHTQLCRSGNVLQPDDFYLCAWNKQTIWAGDNSSPTL